MNRPTDEVIARAASEAAGLDHAEQVIADRRAQLASVLDPVREEREREAAQHVAYTSAKDEVKRVLVADLDQIATTYGELVAPLVALLDAAEAARRRALDAIHAAPCLPSERAYRLAAVEGMVLAHPLSRVLQLLDSFRLPTKDAK
jgi:hypothetical protein